MSRLPLNSMRRKISNVETTRLRGLASYEAAGGSP